MIRSAVAEEPEAGVSFEEACDAYAESYGSYEEVIDAGELLRTTAPSTSCPGESFQMTVSSSSRTISFVRAGTFWTKLGGPKTPASFSGPWEIAVDTAAGPESRRSNDSPKQ